MIRDRLSYANVMATLALFVALGGVGYAAVKLPRDSVGAKQIKEDAVRFSELARLGRQLQRSRRVDRGQRHSPQHDRRE
jgi:hypothetical protein